MKKEKLYCSGRKWLNPSRSDDTGALQYKVSSWLNNWVDAELSIWDCGRKITLNFNFVPSNNGDITARIKKLDEIEAAIKALREGMAEAYKEHVEKDKLRDEEDEF